MIQDAHDRLRPVLAKRDHGFRWRGHDISRIEGLSDAVFAFAITLLVVSLEEWSQLMLIYSAGFMGVYVISALLRQLSLSGMVYMLIGPMQTMLGMKHGKRRKALMMEPENRLAVVGER